MGIEAGRKRPPKDEIAPPPPSGPPLPQCAYCGEGFTRLKSGKIPGHDYPKPCRKRCRGSGQPPKRKESALWKDDPGQEGRDFFFAARQELLIYGFAIVKQMALLSGDRAGYVECPLCGGEVTWSIAGSNGHCAARCGREGCINAME